ncbi:alpha/beta hydrolase family protein [Pseudomonas sp. MBLB4123]|uniref:alpha/beta hydrolase family protein n=1 Tax=Pseudomonas sp. MBLB4123 TaxID=3451557 RepID=UPI003F74F1C0
MRFDTYEFSARDGYPLAVSSYRPMRPRYGLLLNGATGVAQRFYRSFAEHAASRGAWVFCYDYRGIGASRAAAWQGRAPSMADWGRIDQASLLDHLPADLPVAVLGHSVGGQLPGLADNAGRIQALLGVAAQSGYWRLWPANRQWRLALNWYALVPLLTRLCGRLPGWVMGGEALPREVALEWARWCRTPAFIATPDGRPWRPHFAELQAPARFLVIADDLAFAPRKAVEELAGFYTAARREQQIVAPADWGLRSLGHFGFFRREAPRELWNEQLAWLERTLGLRPARAPA